MGSESSRGRGASGRRAFPAFAAPPAPFRFSADRWAASQSTAGPRGVSTEPAGAAMGSPERNLISSQTVTVAMGAGVSGRRLLSRARLRGFPRRLRHRADPREAPEASAWSPRARFPGGPRWRRWPCPPSRPGGLPAPRLMASVAGPRTSPTQALRRRRARFESRVVKSLWRCTTASN